MSHHHMTGQDRKEMVMSDKAGRMLDKATDPVERLRYSSLKRGAAGILGFGKIFRRMDKDGSGSLTLDEFVQGIQESGVDLNFDEIQDLFAKFDRDGSQSIDYKEFIQAIRPPLNNNRLNMVEKAFTKIDADRDGQVAIDHLKHAYDVRSHPDYQNGRSSEEELMVTFIRNFEENVATDGIVTKEEFIDYYSGVSPSIDEDMYFDLVMRQAWHL